ncbi:hypothetical protein Shyhy02_47690 [Streptomyces hygroscopicus subsp. hygroscopicus]|nr:hypothetical protein Shyhy02_47690 [Streptomyces hygroscopicus subsp. hygroscopicus]
MPITSLRQQSLPGLTDARGAASAPLRRGPRRPADERARRRSGDGRATPREPLTGAGNRLRPAPRPTRAAAGDE